MDAHNELNPAQEDVLAQLGADPSGRPRFDSTLRERLRRELEDGLAPILDDIDPSSRLFVSKHLLGMAMGCERRFLAEDDQPFSWSVPIARGTVAHKAIELSIHWKREAVPLDLVDESISRLGEGTDSLAEWLNTCSEVELAELRAEANDRVAKFLECWPPLKASWRPVTEARLRLDLGKVIALSGKVDLTLGRPEGDRAGKVLVDLKTGGFSVQHTHDLRFYALLETVRVGTPPRKLATYYLDQGTFLPEDTTEDLLFAAAARVIDGVARIVRLRKREREPSTLPSRVCSWCPALADCDDGRRYLSDGDELDDGL